jgi:hypothetical protein
MKTWKNILRIVVMVVLAVASLAQPAVATTFISVEPIPSASVVGDANLEKILNIGYARLEAWSHKLVGCRIIEGVIDALSSDRAINTVDSSNTRYAIQAGGFEGITDPTFVFTVEDTGRGAVSPRDVNVLDNALGYVLNQGGTIHLSPDNAKAYDFPLDYAVVQFSGSLSGLGAKRFFDSVGTVDPALWSGEFAGFTQIGNSLLFLQPAVSKRQFVAGLSEVAGRTPGALYLPLTNGGHPTTAQAGVAFPGNDWVQFPGGDQYLANLGNPSPQLLSRLRTLRGQHLQAVSDLLRAIDRGTVDQYLENQFRCPR